MYDLLKPHVSRLVVCDPRKNASMKQGNKNDKIECTPVGRAAARSTSISFNPVYHGEHTAYGSLKRNWCAVISTITKDLGRVMSRVKAIYRSWALIPCSGKQGSLCTAPSWRVARGRSVKRGYAAGRSFTTSNSTH